MAALYLFAFGLIPVGIANVWSGAGVAGSSRQIVYLAIAGLMIGCGMIAYAELLTNKTIDPRMATRTL